MIFLPITPEVKEAAERIAEYAAHEDHWYTPHADLQPPGNNPEHVLRAGNVRAVFSWTRDPYSGDVVRHLTVSVEGRWPQPVVVWTLANMFGFTGAEADETGVVMDKADTWQVGVNDDEQCIAVIEKVEGANG
jgi:hypothetical protein